MFISIIFKSQFRNENNICPSTIVGAVSSICKLQPLSVALVATGVDKFNNGRHLSASFFVMFKLWALTKKKGSPDFSHCVFLWYPFTIYYVSSTSRFFSYWIVFGYLYHESWPVMRLFQIFFTDSTDTYFREYLLNFCFHQVPIFLLN